MKKLLLLITGLALLLAPALSAGDQAEWLTDYKQAVELSKATGKPILADFTGSDWCGYCKKLKRTVFNTEEFKDWASDSVILLELDFPKFKAQERALVIQNRQLAAKYRIRGYPTIVFMDHSGKELGRLGYDPRGADVWLNQAQTIITQSASGP